LSFQFNTVNKGGAGLGQFERDGALSAAEVEHARASAGTANDVQTGKLAIQSKLSLLDSGNFEPAIRRRHLSGNPQVVI
jgi:hypothetical protein